MSAAPVARLSVEEYLKGELTAERPSEYDDGELFPVVFATINHARLVNRISRRMAERLDRGPCEILSQIRVRLSASKFVLPDQAVVCGAAAVMDETQETITNPKVIFEVLSPSARDSDRGGKFELYRQLPSFQEYVLIAQDRAAVEVRRKSPDGRWIMTFYEGLDSVAKLESLDIELPLGELYEGVVLDPKPTP